MKRSDENNGDRNGDSASPLPLADWVDRHGDFLFRFAMARVGNSQIAEDLVQETFLSVLKTSSSFAGESSERTWLTSILKRKIIDHYRQLWRRADFPEAGNADSAADVLAEGDAPGGSPPLDWGENPESALENRELGGVLLRCLEALPGPMAAAFSLREMDGWSTEEICKEFVISPSNLWVMLHRARVRLRRCLEAKWFHPDRTGKG